MKGQGVTKALTWVLCFALFFSLLPTSRAEANHGVDLANAAPTGWTSTILGSGASGGNDNCPTSLGCDASDATGRRVDDHCGSQQVVAARGTHNYCSTGIAFTRTSGVSSFDVSAFRVKVQMCQTGAGSSCGGASLDMIAMVVTGWSGSTCNGTEYGYYTQSASGTLDTGELEFSGTLPIAVTSGTGFCFHAEVTAMNTNQWYTLASLEVYADSLTLPTDIEDYVYGLRLDHPPFQRVISWFWKQDATLAWWITDSDDTVLSPADQLGNPYTVGAAQSVTIQCPIVCGADTYTLHVLPDSHAEDTYVISSDDSGELIGGQPGDISITGVSGCYNADYEQCGTGQLASTVHLVIGIGPDSQPDDVDIEIGTQYLFGPGFDGNAWETDTVDGGTHTFDVTIETPYPVAGQRLLIVATGPNNSVSATCTLDWEDGGPGCALIVGGGGAGGGGGGGGGGGSLDDPPPFELCGPLDAACAARNIIAGLWQTIVDLFVPTVSVGDLVDALFDALADKFPFAWVLGGATAIAALYGAVGEAILDWSGAPYGEWCYSNTLELWHGVGDTSEQTLELCVDTSWLHDQYPAYEDSIRPLLGGGVYVLAIFQLARFLSPKPVVVG